ncbi:MAG: DUF3365 domain-containing protein [Candidatus Scalindua sp.]|nr:DUF3365 domain-containing protein [Candidatus Scalindua sp.]
MLFKKKTNFKLFGALAVLGVLIILSISFSNFQKQSALLREEIFDKCAMIAIELKHTREYLAEMVAVANVGHHEETRGLMPAIAGVKIGEKFYNETGYRLRQVSTKYRNPKNKPDTFEKKALLEFQKNSDLTEYKGIDTINDQRVLRYLLPLYIEEACLKCHSKKETIPEFIKEDYPEDHAADYSYGDLRGAISVIVPIERAETETKNNLIYLTFVTALGTMFLVAIITFVLNITIRKEDRYPSN